MLNIREEARKKEADTMFSYPHIFIIKRILNISLDIVFNIKKVITIERPSRTMLDRRSTKSMLYEITKYDYWNFLGMNEYAGELLLSLYFAYLRAAAAIKAKSVTSFPVAASAKRC
mmetsp:Transcript_28026/g.51199  ORF Transcript_28026/g.51199 Transcript_28026/m.51199 type:complete len:116 (-) Transcript_28026:453-800(-)